MIIANRIELHIEGVSNRACRLASVWISNIERFGPHDVATRKSEVEYRRMVNLLNAIGEPDQAEQIIREVDALVQAALDHRVTEAMADRDTFSERN